MSEAQSLFQEFRAAIFNDLNTPKALSTVSAVLNSKELPASEKLGLLYNFDEVLGLGMDRWQEEKIELSGELKDLLAQRQKARAEKNWPEADRIRERFAELGFAVVDSPQGPVLKKK